MGCVPAVSVMSLGTPYFMELQLPLDRLGCVPCHDDRRGPPVKGPDWSICETGLRVYMPTACPDMAAGTTSLARHKCHDFWRPR
jgi:hypothetical protein